MAVKANWVGMVQMCGGGRTGAAMGRERERMCACQERKVRKKGKEEIEVGHRVGMVFKKPMAIQTLRNKILFSKTINLCWEVTQLTINT